MRSPQHKYDRLRFTPLRCMYSANSLVDPAPFILTAPSFEDVALTYSLTQSVCDHDERRDDIKIRLCMRLPQLPKHAQHFIAFLSAPFFLNAAFNVNPCRRTKHINGSTYTPSS